MANLRKNLERYLVAQNKQGEVKRKLGDGTDGSVWEIGENTAAKVFERDENYNNELECYLRLSRNGINQINGMAVPILLGCASDLLVIEMTIVQPPYVLDFGKVHIDTPPPYYHDSMIISDLHQQIRELFGSNTDAVHEILYDLKRLGIYYADPKPANIRFEEDGDE